MNYRFRRKQFPSCRRRGGCEADGVVGGHPALIPEFSPPIDADERREKQEQ
jgi:hypothetical protein